MGSEVCDREERLIGGGDKRRGLLSGEWGV